MPLKVALIFVLFWCCCEGIIKNVTVQFCNLIVSESGCYEIFVEDTFPKNATSYERIEIKGHLDVVPERSFMGLPQLYSISMVSNGIKIIKPGAFRNLQNKFHTLAITHNEIIHLQAGIFDHLPVKFLLLHSNKIRSIEPEVLRDLKQLYYLDLSNNKIKNLNSLWFYNCPLLHSIDFSYNQIESIPPHAFQHLSIQNNYVLPEKRNPEIYLSHNKIKTIEANAFTGPEEIYNLSLGNNKIENVHLKAFQRIYRIYYASLDNNRIESLDKKVLDTFRKTRELAITDNPLGSDFKTILMSFVQTYNVKVL